MQPIKATHKYYQRAAARGVTRRARRAAFRVNTVAASYIRTSEGKKRSWSAEMRSAAWSDWLRAQKVLCSPIGAEILARVRLERLGQKLLGQTPMLMILVQRILFIEGFGTQDACEELAACIATAIEHGNPDVAQARAADADGSGVIEWDVDMGMWTPTLDPAQGQEDATLELVASESSAVPTLGPDPQAQPLVGVPHVCLTPRILAQRPINARATWAGLLT